MKLMKYFFFVELRGTTKLWNIMALVLPLAFTKQVQGQLCDRKSKSRRNQVNSWNSHLLISSFFSAGENAVFSCATEMKLTGLTATWMKDNKPIGDAMADRVKITAKDNVFTLEVSSVKVEDKGQYTCRVTNAGGEVATCSAQLEVHQRKCSSFH